MQGGRQREYEIALYYGPEEQMFIIRDVEITAILYYFRVTNIIPNLGWWDGGGGPFHARQGGSYGLLKNPK